MTELTEFHNGATETTETRREEESLAEPIAQHMRQPKAGLGWIEYRN
jgi:hypothetical protein